ncbi:hypothetical protein J1N35_044048, partial [Gossypium stocksii]
ETLIYGRDYLSFEDVKGNLLSKDKLNNESGLNKKIRWASLNSSCKRQTTNQNI